MSRKLRCVLVISLSSLLFSVTGCEDSNRFAIGAKSGTLGLGGEFTAKILPAVNWRVGYNTLDFEYDDLEIRFQPPRDKELLLIASGKILGPLAGTRKTDIQLLYPVFEPR